MPKKLGNKWSLLYDRCIECGRKDSKHASHGVCKRCFSRANNHSAKRRAYAKTYYKSYYSDPAHLERRRQYHKDYYRRQRDAARQNKEAQKRAPRLKAILMDDPGTHNYLTPVTLFEIMHNVKNSKKGLFYRPYCSGVTDLGKAILAEIAPTKTKEKNDD